MFGKMKTNVQNIYIYISKNQPEHFSFSPAQQNLTKATLKYLTIKRKEKDVFVDVDEYGYPSAHKTFTTRLERCNQLR